MVTTLLRLVIKQSLDRSLDVSEKNRPRVDNFGQLLVETVIGDQELCSARSNRFRGATATDSIFERASDLP